MLALIFQPKPQFAIKNEIKKNVHGCSNHIQFLLLMTENERINFR